MRNPLLAVTYLIVGFACYATLDTRTSEPANADTEVRAAKVESFAPVAVDQLIDEASSLRPEATSLPNSPIVSAATEAVPKEVEVTETIGVATLGKVAMRVEGLKPQGTIRLALFRRSGFPNSEKALRTVSRPVSGRSIEIVVDALEPGEYAASVYQDLNDDRVLNKGAFGIPQEPYGFSNNARGNFGPPAFTQASFVMAEKNVQLSIMLK